jgi:magnesium transporter
MLILARGAARSNNVYDHLRRINGATESMRDTIGAAIQVNLSMVTIEESEVTKRLAPWAAIISVVPALAGTWGMNFQHVPDLASTYGYPASLSVMAAVCAALYRRFKAARW